MNGGKFDVGKLGDKNLKCVLDLLNDGVSWDDFLSFFFWSWENQRKTGDAKSR